MDAAAYVAAGFAVVEGAIAPEQASALAAAVERVQGAVGGLPPALREQLVLERDLPARHRGHAPLAPVGDALFILGDPPRFDPAFQTLLHAPALRRAAEAALGTADLVVHFMNVTVKHPRFGRAIAWHRDFPNRYICTARPRFVRPMICLDGMDAESGATAFLPGSHLAGAGVPPRPGPDARARLACCGPGGMVVIHPEVLHGGAGNASPRWRRNVVVQIGAADEPLVTEAGESLTGTPLPS